MVNLKNKKLVQKMKSIKSRYQIFSITLKCLSNSNKIAETDLTIISLCLLTSIPSFIDSTTDILEMIWLLGFGSNLAIIKKTYGISSGNTSVIMLIDSVLAFEVGAAARSIFSKAIMY